MEPPPILENRKSVLPSLNIPPAAYPISTIPKSAPENVPQIETEFPFEEPEESIHTTKQQEGPMKIVTSSTKFKPRRMDMVIPKLPEKLSENTSEDKTKNNSNVITSIPAELATVYNPNTPTTSFKILSCRKNLTYLRNNYENFLSADAEITTPIGR